MNCLKHPLSAMVSVKTKTEYVLSLEGWNSKGGNQKEGCYRERVTLSVWLLLAGALLYPYL